MRCPDEDLCVTKCYIVQYPVLLADCCCGFTRCASEHWPCLFTYKLVSGRVREEGGRKEGGGGGEGGRKGRREIAQVGASTDMTKLKAMLFGTTHLPMGEEERNKATDMT